MYNIKLPSYRKKGEYGFMGKILVKRFNYALSIIKKNQSAYKPGSVLTKLYKIMRSACHLSAPAVADVLYRSTLQRVVAKYNYLGRAAL